MLEFVLRTASLMALVAFAVYSILPAFPQMIAHFSPDAPGDIQFAITGLYFGMAIGQLLCGPLSDSLGRKRAMLGACSCSAPDVCWPCPLIGSRPCLPDSSSRGWAWARRAS
jgi:MFS family permease